MSTFYNFIRAFATS